jgi:hypothetical protein
MPKKKIKHTRIVRVSGLWVVEARLTATYPWYIAGYSSVKKKAEKIAAEYAEDGLLRKHYQKT